MGLIKRNLYYILYVASIVLIFLLGNFVFGQWFPESQGTSPSSMYNEGRWSYPNRNFPFQSPTSYPPLLPNSPRPHQPPAQTDPAEGWTLMSGITDLFLEVKALSSTDTLIVSTAESGMYWTGDLGASWDTLPTPTTNIVSHEIFRNQGRTEILIVPAGSAPYLRRSTDMGQTWTPASEHLPNLQAHRLYLDQYHRLWAFYGSKIYFSDDYGIGWDSLTVASEVTRIWNVWVSPQDSTKLWVAADRAGAYFSPNRGQSWTRSYVGGDVHDIEGNPQNPYSAIAIMYENEMYWNHGNGTWEPLYFPVSGQWGDITFLNGDSLQLLGIRGYTSYNTIDNIYRSSNSGQSWFMDCGPLVSAGGWRIQNYNTDLFRIGILLSGGELLCNESWNQHQRLNVGTKGDCYVISNHQLGLVYAWAQGGTYITDDGGLTWISTPFASGMQTWAEHSGRTAFYEVKSGQELFLLSFPSLQFDTLVPLPEPALWVATSEADTSLLYSLSCYGHLFISHDGANSPWQMINYPTLDTRVCKITPSSTIPGFALLATTPFWYFPPPMVWRTYDFGQSWELIFQGNFPGNYAWIWDSWSGDDDLTDYSFFVQTDPGAEYWYFYTLNGGDSFDSIRTGLASTQGEGYACMEWGDSVMVVGASSENSDSIFISPDHFQSMQFRVCYPEGIQAQLFNGGFSQLISKDWDTDRTFYHGPHTACPPQNHNAIKPNNISISIYPNPTNSTAFLNLSGSIITHPIQIQIYDILGRHIRTMQIGPQVGESPLLTLPINNLSSGTYFVVVSGSELSTNITRKIIILK
jgi:photosystem II stability/assembly factor-like uncharacterized protein